MCDLFSRINQICTQMNTNNIFNKIFLFFLLLLTAITTMAQVKITGTVVDEKGQPIEFATVKIAGTAIGVNTDTKGRYEISAPTRDTVMVVFSCLGYSTVRRQLLKPTGSVSINPKLYSSSIELEGVQITEFKKQTNTLQSVDIESMHMAPNASGNSVEAIIATQAGVSSKNEMSSQYMVRGGSYDENSVYINGIEVHRPQLVSSGQQEGLSVINPDMVRSVAFSTGGFNAEYSDKMSSVLDITYKEPEAFEGAFSASMQGGSLALGTSTKKFSMLHGVRYKRNSSLLGGTDTKGEYDPQYFDYQTHIVLKPSNKFKVSFLGNVALNDYKFIPKNRETSFGTSTNAKTFLVYFDGQEKDLFRTYFGTFSITRHFGDSTSVSILGSAFSSKEQERYDIQGQYWLTQTETSENLGVGTYFEHARNYLKSNVASVKLMVRHKTKRHAIEGGLTWKTESVKERSVEYEMRDSAGYSIPHNGKDLYMIYSLKAVNSLKANRIEGYLQDTYRFRGANQETLYTLNYGVRFSHWNFNKETIVSPRVSLGIVPAFNQDLTFRLATGLYYQAPFYKELRDTTTVNGVTIAELNKKIKSQRSIHFIGAVDYRFKLNNRPYKFTAEAYYKALGNLVPYSVNNVKVVYYGNNECSGHAAGIDLKLFGEFVPGTDSWISLSIMDAKMKLNGKSIPLPTNQRYGINMFFTDYFPGTDRWKMSLKLAFADGLPFSAPHRETERNSFRAPAYKRADIGMSYRLFENETKRKNMPFRNVWLGVDCLNLLGINNVNSYYWITDVTNQQYAVPNYLTGRMLNARVLFEF